MMSIPLPVCYLTGYVGFSAEGGSPARFLQAAADSGIPLWHVRREGITLSACCAARHYARLRRPARRAGLRLHLTGRRGLEFHLRRLRGRSGLAVGLVLSLLLWQLLSCRIWAVTVNGNDTLPEDSVRRTVQEWGVYVGAPIKTLDIETIRLEALCRVEGVAWLTVNLEGSVAHVELLESDPPIDIRTTDPPSNLIAARDGWILRTEIYGGEALVRPGDAVAAGTLLVSGATIADKSLLLRRSVGRVIARTERELSVAVPFAEECLLPGPSAYRVSFMFFGWEIPLYTPSPLPDLTETRQDDRLLTFRGLPLPLGLRHRQITSLIPSPVTRTGEQAYTEAVRRLRAREAAELSASRVLESRYICETVNQTCILTGYYICEEDIAREQRLYVEKND